MLTTWSPPAIVQREAGPTYKSNAPKAVATTIMWTQTEPAHETFLLEQGSTYIQALQNWIAREHDLARIRTLGNNWDGLDADAPDLAVVNRAEFFLRVLKEYEPANPPMRIVLAPDGSISFEWVEDNRFVQAEISDSAKVEWMVAIPGEATVFGIESLEEPSIYGGAKQGHAWQPAPAVTDEPAYASAH